MVQGLFLEYFNQLCLIFLYRIMPISILIQISYPLLFGNDDCLHVLMVKTRGMNNDYCRLLKHILGKTTTMFCLLTLMLDLQLKTSIWFIGYRLLEICVEIILLLYIYDCIHRKYSVMIIGVIAIRVLELSTLSF